jgi:hypothetical protein
MGAGASTGLVSQGCSSQGSHCDKPEEFLVETLKVSLEPHQGYSSQGEAPFTLSAGKISLFQEIAHTPRAGIDLGWRAVAFSQSPFVPGSPTSVPRGTPPSQQTAAPWPVGPAPGRSSGAVPLTVRARRRLWTIPPHGQAVSPPRLVLAHEPAGLNDWRNSRRLSRILVWTRATRGTMSFPSSRPRVPSRNRSGCFSKVGPVSGGQLTAKRCPGGSKGADAPRSRQGFREGRSDPREGWRQTWPREVLRPPRGRGPACPSAHWGDASGAKNESCGQAGVPCQFLQNPMRSTSDANRGAVSVSKYSQAWVKATERARDGEAVAASGRVLPGPHDQDQRCHSVSHPRAFKAVTSGLATQPLS